MIQFQQKLLESREITNSDNDTFEESSHELDRKQNLIDSYSHEISLLKQDNMEQLHNINKVQQNQEQLQQEYEVLKDKFEHKIKTFKVLLVAEL